MTGPRSSYMVLPIFALANAGVVLDTAAIAGKWSLTAGIAAGLTPLAFVLASLAVVRFGPAVDGSRPPVYDQRG